MSDKEIVEQALKKSGQEYPMKLSGVPFDHSNAIFSIIFSHSFAKGFFGEKKICHVCSALDGEQHEMICSVSPGTFHSNDSTPYLRAWEYHLRRMVLSDNPIKYLKLFLDGG